MAKMTPEQAEAEYGRYFCRRCADKGVGRPADEQFSMGVYAGMYCDKCWAEDGRNHERDFDPAYAGERMEEEN